MVNGICRLHCDGRIHLVISSKNPEPSLSKLSLSQFVRCHSYFSYRCEKIPRQEQFRLQRVYFFDYIQEKVARLRGEATWQVGKSKAGDWLITLHLRSESSAVDACHAVA